MSQHFNILLGTVNLNNRIDIQKLLHHSEVRKWQELSIVGPKVNQVWLSPIISSSTKFEVNPSNSLYENAWKQLNQSNGKKLLFSGACPKVNQAWGIPYKDLTNQRPGYNGNLAEHEQKFFIRPRGHYEFIHQCWGQSDQRFVENYTKTAQPIRGKQWEYSGASIKSEDFLMTSPTKFEVILISYSSMHGNCSSNQRPGNGENSAESDHPSPTWMGSPTKFRSIQSAVCLKMYRNLERVADEIMHGQGQMIWYL